MPGTSSQDLEPLAFTPLPLGKVKPAGWLLNQLRIQAEGLSGHLDEFWPDVADSAWRGGDAEGWERAPYWLDGVVPLAFLLDDERLIQKASAWVDDILARQQPDGWLGEVLDRTIGDPARVRPGGSPYSPFLYDAWPRFILLKVLIQYREATGDPRILPAMTAFLRKVDAILDEYPLRSWARFRWADLVHAIHWLHGRTGEAWLLDLAARVQAQGFDWVGHFERFPFKGKLFGVECDLTSHGPNNAMALKTGAVWSRQSGDARDREMAARAIDVLDRYHGQANGMFSCDEHLAGRDSMQGSELCAVVEYMYSLEVLTSILGDGAFADRLERLAFNALPATISPDMWTHQYDQQVNQVICRVDADRVYTSNGPDANLFGLEPHYGCCTANMHQGWPKLASHTWMRAPDGGLAAVTYVPCRVRTDVAGTPVEIAVETGYPFEDRVRITVRMAGDVTMPVHLRIPAWTGGATVRVERGGAAPVTPGTWHILPCAGGETTIDLDLASPFRVESRDRGAVAIHRGPLLYGLRIAEEWRKVVERPTVDDFAIDPLSPWNYALDLDPAMPEVSLDLSCGPVGERPFAPESAPCEVHARGRRIDGWEIAHNAAGPVPESPVASDAPLEDLVLVPYGCTNLRVAEFPLLAADRIGINA